MLGTGTQSRWQLLSYYQGLNQFREDGGCEHFNISLSQNYLEKSPV